jgi:Mce-associated membrane protein
VTVALPRADDTQAVDREVIDDGQVRLAPWGLRAAAIALDVLPGVAVVATMVILALAAPNGSLTWWVFISTAIVAAFATLANRCLLPSLIGSSFGRAVVGIRVVRGKDGQSAGVLTMLLRELAHLLDTAAVFVGWLWPLWDRRKRTFADLLLRTEVREVPGPERNVRRIAACVLVVAAVLCVAGAGLGYAVVYRTERATDQARAEIAAQGPRIVEQLLSYGATTAQKDFATAQALATDAYRPLLITQQDAAAKAGLTSNEYWTVNSAVLSAAPHRGALLLALQGQRGDDPAKQRFITATVRVDFEQAKDGAWQVAQLTVLKRPQADAPGQ